MALTKLNGSLAQLTANGNSAAVDIVGAYAALFSIRHVNGTGAITTGGRIQPQISHDGATWYNDGGPFVFGLVASATEFATYVPPTDGLAGKHVRFVYTVPTGSTGHNVNFEYTRTTEL